MSEVQLELLLGKQVYDIEGKAVGRLEEIKAEMRGTELYVIEYHVGVYALFERLSALAIGRAVLTAMGGTRPGSRKSVPWSKLDMRDLQHLKLTCSEADLTTFE